MRPPRSEVPPEPASSLATETTSRLPSQPPETPGGDRWGCGRVIWEGPPIVLSLWLPGHLRAAAGSEGEPSQHASHYSHLVTNIDIKTSQNSLFIIPKHITSI